MASNEANFNRAALQLEAEMLEAVEIEFKSIAFEFLARVQLGTPVDTGRARANWGLVDSAPGTTEDNPVVSVTKDGINVIFLYNNLPYIISLEMGSSQQAPSGFIRLVAAELGLTIIGDIGG